MSIIHLDLLLIFKGLIEDTDANKDGKVTLEELLTFVEHLRTKTKDSTPGM